MSEFDPMVGRTFGRLTVLHREPNDKHGAIKYACQCSCENHPIISVYKTNLVSGNSTSCGCLQRERISGYRLIDLVGKTFGRLTVIKRADSPKGSKCPRWVCRCSCGNIVEVMGTELRGGGTQSCGCLKREMCISRSTKWKDDIERALTARFDDMKKRCYNPNCAGFHRWGGRGIRICDEWLADRSKFIDWAKSNGFKPGLEIDRIDNDGPYAPWNCRWVSRLDQANNKSNNTYVCIDGFTQTLAQWSRSIGCTQSYLSYLNCNKPEQLNMLLMSEVFFKQLNKLHSLEEQNG